MKLVGEPLLKDFGVIWLHRDSRRAKARPFSRPHQFLVQPVTAHRTQARTRAALRSPVYHRPFNPKATQTSKWTFFAEKVGWMCPTRAPFSLVLVPLPLQRTNSKRQNPSAPQSNYNAAQPWVARLGCQGRERAFFKWIRYHLAHNSGESARVDFRLHCHVFQGEAHEGYRYNIIQDHHPK